MAEQPVAVEVPDLTIVTEADCPLCGCECTPDAVGWACLNCGSSWNQAGHGGKRWVHPKFLPVVTGEDSK